MFPLFKYGTKEPIVEATFGKGHIAEVGLGCGYISIVDDQSRVFSWGDNYAGQLGTGDDVHRDTPHLV